MWNGREVETPDHRHLPLHPGPGGRQRPGSVVRAESRFDQHIGRDEHLAGAEVHGLETRDRGDARLRLEAAAQPLDIPSGTA